MSADNGGSVSVNVHNIGDKLHHLAAEVEAKAEHLEEEVVAEFRALKAEMHEWLVKHGIIKQ